MNTLALGLDFSVWQILIPLIFFAGVYLAVRKAVGDGIRDAMIRGRAENKNFNP